MTKKILLNIPFDIDREVQKDFPSNQTITKNYLTSAVNLGYKKEGLTSDKRRIWAALTTRLEKAVKDNLEYFEVNDYELIFIKNAYENAVVSPETADVFTLVENEVMNAQSIPSNPSEVVK